VIQVKHAQSHGETVPQACYHECHHDAPPAFHFGVGVDLLAGLPASPALAIDEADRLWLVGERSFADGCTRSRAGCSERSSSSTRATAVAAAIFYSGDRGVALGDSDKALDASADYGRSPRCPRSKLEGRFWEAEGTHRLKRCRRALWHDDVIGKDAASALASEALYVLPLRPPSCGVRSPRSSLPGPPRGLAEHTQAARPPLLPAQTLVDLKRYRGPPSSRVPTSIQAQAPPGRADLLGSTRLAWERDAGWRFAGVVAAIRRTPMAATARRTIPGRRQVRQPEPARRAPTRN